MTPALKNWLLKKNPTPAELKLYRLAVKLCRGEKISFQNREIVALYGTSRKNIRQNLVRMIGKGLISKMSRFDYVPVVPKIKN